MPTASRTNRSRGARRQERAQEAARSEPGYAEVSRKPLHVLIFLLPLLVAYELGSIRYLTDDALGNRLNIAAHTLLDRFFAEFGVELIYLPGVALVTVLLIWHVLARDPWRIQLGVLAGMLLETAVWTMPLIVMAAVFAGSAPLLQQGAGGAAEIHELPWQARLTMSIGAGLYEELLFRMILIALIHTIIVDVAKLRNSVGFAVAVVGSAAAFAFYHDLSPGHTRAIDWGLAAFLFLAGVYFGVVYLLRGFGIVAGVHALFDILVLVVMSPTPVGAGGSG